MPANGTEFNGDSRMSDETKFIKLRTKNAKMLMLYGDTLTPSEWLRSIRTNGLHSEVQFSDRYGSISFSSTLSDGCNGCRFKMIGYSHPYRWSTLKIPVTAEQEYRLFAKACEMADVSKVHPGETKGIGGSQVDELMTRLYIGAVKPNEVIFGPNHIKYDKWGARLAFITKWEIFKMHRVKMICSEACANVLLEVWPDMLLIKGPNIDSIDWPLELDSAQLTPDQLQYQAEYYFNNLKESNNER